MHLPAFEFAEVFGANGSDGSLSSPDTTILSCLLTDSRDLAYPEKTVFFAIRTDVNNGHLYIPGLYSRGVRYFVVDEDVSHLSLPPDATVWRVPDVVDALQRLAAYVRSRYCGDTLVIGVTGSQGKTVVKELLYLALSRRVCVVRSPRSYNSQIGVPLSIWEIDEGVEVAVIEAGISQPGEMERLHRIIRPDIGVFTSLTSEHRQGFESISLKAEEKLCLMRGAECLFYQADRKHSDIIVEAAEITGLDAPLVGVSGGNKELVKAVACLVLQRLGADSAGIDEYVDSLSERISSRIVVTETLKCCTVVYDGFTCDLRAVYDALNATRRHLTASQSLTLILTSPDVPVPPRQLASLLKAMGVSRFIGVGREFDTFSCRDIVTERVPSVQCFLDSYSISDFDSEVILVKGGNGSRAEDIKALLEAPRHETVMEVDLGAITANFNFFRSRVLPSTGVVCMVKANAYGVGAVEISKTLQCQGAAYLAVAVIDEGVALRRAGISMPVMVMNPISTNYKALFDNALEPSVFSLRELSFLLDNARRLDIRQYPIHIKLDTGMHRLGFLKSEIPDLLEVLLHQDYVRVVSIFSHLATADCLDQDEYTLLQLRNFDDMSSEIMEALPYPVKRHVLNTAGILRYPQYQYDMVRLGIGLYGVAPIDGYSLSTVASLQSTIISIKHWDAGDTIGYGRRGVVSGPSTIATVAIGYADGLNRHLSNHAAYVMVKGSRCDIIGNICMDQCMVDVTGVDAQIGDSVEVFGREAPIGRLADTLQTIPYEVLTSVSQRVKRVYFKE